MRPMEWLNHSMRWWDCNLLCTYLDGIHTLTTELERFRILTLHMFIMYTISENSFGCIGQ